MFTNRFRTTTRAVTVALALGVLASSTLLASGGSAASQDPMYRKVAPPNVMFPVIGDQVGQGPEELLLAVTAAPTSGPPVRRGVFATHPGTAQVLTNPKA